MGIAETRHPAGSEPTARWKRTAQAPAEALLPPCRTRDRVGHRPGTTGAAADGRAGVGGLHTSEDVGERVGPRTRPSKGGPCWCELAVEGTHDRRVDVGTHVTRNSKGSGPSASDSRANLGRIAMSHISGRAGWWKPPSPVLVRASGEQSPGATRQSKLARHGPNHRCFIDRRRRKLGGPCRSSHSAYCTRAALRPFSHRVSWVEDHRR